MGIGFMRVVYIRAPKERGHVRIGLSDGERKIEYTVSESDYRALGAPLVGDEICDLSPLSEADMRYRARLTALRILGYGDNNERTLIRKLIMKSVSVSVAKEIAEEMRSLGYINERRQLNRLIEHEVNLRLSGPRKVYSKLLQKGYRRGDIEEVLNDLISHGVVDFEDSKARLVKKRLPCDADEEEILRLLYNHGY